VRVVKNKVAPPFQEVEIDIMNVGGISQVGSVLDTAEKYGVVQKSGAFLKFDNEILGQGREVAKAMLTEKPEWTDKIEKAIWARVKSV
jgi:recombination protein RecA